MITGKELVEKMYSDNYSEYEDTRLYSTGDSDLDELLEKAFCEGYKYAQREFNSKAQVESDMTEEDAEAIGKWLKDEGGSDVYRRAYRDEKRKHTKKGRRIGAASGALGGAALVPLIGKNDEEYKTNKAGCIIGGSIVGTGAGILNGHIIGSIAGRKLAKKKAAKEREEFERLVDETTKEMKKDIRNKNKNK